MKANLFLHIRKNFKCYFVFSNFFLFYCFQCYVNCVLEMMQIIRKGKLNYDSAINQIKRMLPAHLQENYLHGVNTCRDSGEYKEGDVFL